MVALQDIGNLASTTQYPRLSSQISTNVFLALFGIAMVIRIILGLKWRTWFFGVDFLYGCVSEMVGYGGRIMLWENPFSFVGFLMQISELISCHCEEGREEGRMRERETDNRRT